MDNQVNIKEEKVACHSERSEESFCTTQPSKNRKILRSAQDDSYKDRLFNIRPICFWAFFVALTVAVCIGYANRPWLVGVYFVCLIALFVVLQFVESRDKVLTFFGTSRLNFIITLVLCFVVAFSFAITTLSFTHQKSYAGFHELSGIVERHRIRDDDTGWFILTNVKFGDQSVSGNVAVYVNSSNESLRANVISTHRVSITTQLRTANPNNYNVNNNIKYTANVGANVEITAAGVDRSPRSEITRYSQNFLRKHMSNRNADLMFAMLFGDRSDLDGELSESFSLTGIAHVLSVSGLHVGLLVGMLVFILNRCRVSRKKQIPIIAVLLLFYCYLCGFRLSILRAAIMFMVFVVRRAFLRSNDMLSSLALAGIIILILFPYSLMSASLQFSFACMLGIAMFNLPFTKFFREKAKLPKWLSSALSMYCATFLACLPLMIKYFGFVSLLGLFTNVLFLPLLVLAFQVSFISVLTWVAFPLLYIINVTLDVIISVTHWLASLPFATITTPSGQGYWFLLYFVGLIFTSRFIFLRPRYKYSAAAILILLYGLSVLI